MFTQLLNNLVEVANADYGGVVVWGWSNVYELSDAYSGKFFPPALNTHMRRSFLITFSIKPLASLGV